MGHSEDQAPELSGEVAEERLRATPDHDTMELDWLLDATRARLFGASAEPSAIGRYVVLGRLGAGSTGTVYEAFDRTLDRRVALKVLRRHLASIHGDRFIREGQALARLSHPNVVQVYEVGESEGRAFIAMELVTGRTLGQWGREEPRPDWRACVEVYLQAGAGLAAAHEQGLVHRDFKPSNVMLNAQGRVCILDFGLARTASDLAGTASGPSLVSRDTAVTERGSAPVDSSGSRVDLRLTETGCVLGTPAYMSLEQMRGRSTSALSDQFSFCVALYEAVYGERPFKGNSLDVLKRQLASGSIRAPGSSSRAPARLRAIVSRGLAAQPEQRWPSMAVLLQELRALVEPRRRRASMVVVLSAGALLGALGVAQWSGAEPRCTDGSAQLEGIWDPPRREAARQAWAEAEPTLLWSAVESRLNRYARDWADTYREICEATRITQEQSEEVMDLRMGCLAERRRRLMAASQALMRRSVEGEARLSSKALSMVDALPGLERCDAIDQLRAQRQRVPPPAAPATAAAVDEAREHLAEVRSEQALGRYAYALEQLEPVMARAEALGYWPLQAEAMLLRGSLRDDDGEYDDAERDLLDAHTLALEHGGIELASRAAQKLAYVVGLKHNRYAEAMVWANVAIPLAANSGLVVEQMRGMSTVGSILSDQGRYADAESWLARALELGETEVGVEEPSVVGIINRMGTLMHEQGRYADAERLYRRALARWTELHGEDHPLVAVGLLNVASALTPQARHEEAERMVRRAAELQERLLGPDHPELANTLNSLAASLMNQGRYDSEAEALFEKTYEVHVRAFGPEHPRVAMSLYNLARLHSIKGASDRAREFHERALGIRERALGPEHPEVARSLNSLGLVFERQGECARARRLFSRALAIQREALGDEHPATGLSQNNLASADECEGAYEEAARGYQDALATWERALGAEHPHVSVALVGLANVGLAQGQPIRAREHAARAVSILEAAREQPERLAEARFVLARAMWAEPADRAQSWRLALSARADHARPSEVEAWLRKHPAP